MSDGACEACGEFRELGRRLMGDSGSPTVNNSDIAGARVCNTCGDRLSHAEWDALYARIRARSQQQEQREAPKTWVHSCGGQQSWMLDAGVDCARCGLTYEQAKERARYAMRVVDREALAAQYAEAAVMHEAAPSRFFDCDGEPVQVGDWIHNTGNGCTGNRKARVLKLTREHGDTNAELSDCPARAVGIDKNWRRVDSGVVVKPENMRLVFKEPDIGGCKCIDAQYALGEVECQLALLARVTLDLRMLDLLAPGLCRGNLLRMAGAEP